MKELELGGGGGKRKGGELKGRGIKRGWGGGLAGVWYGLGGIFYNSEWERIPY